MDFNDYQKKASVTAQYPTLETLTLENILQLIKDEGVSIDESVIANVTKKAEHGSNLYYPTMGLAGEAGEVADKVKKIMRDSKGIVSDDTRVELSKEIGDVLWYIASVCTELNINMSDVAQANIDKLYSRKERGVIQGNGDNR